jgi:glycine C-acetyltransferase
MNEALRQRLAARLDEAREAGTFKAIRPILSAMGARVTVPDAGRMLMFASNDYLGMANHPSVVAAARQGLDRYGAGTAGARFICGTTNVHLEFEQELAAFFGKEAAVTISSGFAANVALIPVLTRPGDLVAADALNHASLIDAARLVPQGVERIVYPHADMTALDEALRRHKGDGARFIVTDGVFSMEGDVAQLDRIVALARQFEATVVVDDAHGIGTVGATGRGCAEHYGLLLRTDIITGSLGKALAGAAGGFVAGPREIVETITQFGRPQLFSTALPVASVSASRAALRLLATEPRMVAELAEKTRWFRALLAERGLPVHEGQTPIVVLMIGDTARAMEMAKLLVESRVYVVAFGFPVVPEGAARLRLQVSRSHTENDLTLAAQLIAQAWKRTNNFKVRNARIDT